MLMQTFFIAGYGLKVMTLRGHENNDCIGDKATASDDLDAVVVAHAKLFYPDFHNMLVAFHHCQPIFLRKV